MMRFSIYLFAAPEEEEANSNVLVGGVMTRQVKKRSF
jgi:hypothetical protein